MLTQRDQTGKPAFPTRSILRLYATDAPTTSIGSAVLYPLRARTTWDKTDHRRCSQAHVCRRCKRTYKVKSVMRRI
jgi:hypothetical protein